MTPPGWTATSWALLVAAGLGSPVEHALVCLLALNGLRVSEATGASIENLGAERGHRTLVITRKGGKVVTIPLAPRTARAIDPAVGERVDGPIFLAPDRQRLDRHGAARVVRRVAISAGIRQAISPAPGGGLGGAGNEEDLAEIVIVVPPTMARCRSGSRRRCGPGPDRDAASRQ
jgi:hypothetical protein